MKAQLIATALALFTSALATSVAITGVSGDTHPRLEVRQLATEQPEQWSLFVLAMKQWQAVDNNDTTSYYQVSGIHGVPLVNWDGVGPCDGCAAEAYGYCTHDSVLFPAWHRSYVALFEQQLVAVAQSIAATYPASSRSTYVAAASALRMPYWDWAAKPCSGNVLPTELSGTSITVTGPDGEETLDNPLYSYTFEDPSNLVYQYFTTFEHTLRYPSSDAAAATSKENSAINAFQNVQPSLQDSVYQLMSTCDDYLSFSNDVSATASCATSIEAIHNTVHGTLGGPEVGSITGGHMTYLPVAGFDPSFWFHHANVDRLFAIWQTLHPDSYGASQVAPHTTWTIEEGSTQDATSPLKPFAQDTAGTFWTTDDIRDWESAFHYTYPEFISTDGSEAAVASLVNELYGPSATLCAGEIPATSQSSSSSSSSAATSTSSSAVSSATSGIFAGRAVSGYSASTTSSAAGAYATGGGMYYNVSGSAVSTSSQPYSSAAVPSKYVASKNGSEYQYVANCESQRHALNGSYYVMLFNGEPSSESTSAWFTDSNLIGLLSFLDGGNMNSTMLSTGAVPLTRTLQKQVSSGVIADMSEKSCVPWMKKNLVWKVFGPQGIAVEPAHVPGFKVAVYSSTSTGAGQYSLPKWSGFVPHYEVTEAKSGGASAASPPSYSSGSSGSSTGSGSNSGSSSSSNSGSGSTGGSSQSAPSYGSGSSSAAAPAYGSSTTAAAALPSASASQSAYVSDDDVTTITVWTTHTETFCPCATA